MATMFWEGVSKLRNGFLVSSTREKMGESGQEVTSGLEATAILHL